MPLVLLEQVTRLLSRLHLPHARIPRDDLRRSAI